jgi:diaphanous 1
MPDNSSSLIVPTLLTTGSIHFAEVRSAASIVQDVIDSLVALDGVKSDILEGLDEAGWALQKIRQAESGRFWEEGEFNAMGDGQITSCVLLSAITYL